MHFAQCIQKLLIKCKVCILHEVTKIGLPIKHWLFILVGAFKIKLWLWNITSNMQHACCTRQKLDLMYYVCYSPWTGACHSKCTLHSRKSTRQLTLHSRRTCGMLMQNQPKERRTKKSL